MSLVRPVPGFIPPVVGLPAANAIVPFVPPVVGGAAAVGGLIGGAPPVVVIGGAIMAGALLGAALEQLWGWANGGRGAGRTVQERPTQVPTGLTGGDLYVPPAGYSIRVYDSGGGGIGVNYGPPISTWFEVTGWYNEELGIPQGWLWLGTPTSTFKWREGGGTLVLTNGMPPANITITAVKTGEPSQPLAPFVPQPNWDGQPLPLPPVLPQEQPEAEPLPERPRQVPPLTVPTIPGSRPVGPAPAGVPTPTTPRTSPPPATLPRVPGFPAPVPTRTPSPTGTQTQPDGTLAPTPKTPVVKTPTNVHVIDGFPIPGNGPRPTPEGTAQELGRIERKLAQLLDTKSDAPGQPRDRLGWLRDNIVNIVDFFLSTSGGGEYRISSPCELDENGDRIERVVTYDGNLQSLGVISNKIDALAELLQEHKDLKQPICRQTPAVGQPVTVNFVQVD